MSTGIYDRTKAKFNKGHFQKGCKPWNAGLKGVVKFSKEVNMKKGSKGSKNPNWRDGRILSALGYIWITDYKHPFRDSHNHIYEHRLVIEKYLERYLKPKEAAHHINKDKSDNRVENLMLFRTHGVHVRFERNYHIKKKDIMFDGRNISQIKTVTYLAVRGRNAYEVSRGRDGKASCSCAGFVARAKCPHITEYYERQMAHKEKK